MEVEIAAIAGPGLPTEEREGPVLLRRHPPAGIWSRWAYGREGGRPGGPTRLVDLAVKLACWPVHVRGWWATLLQRVAPADLYHAFGILGIPIALRLAARARRAGRLGRVVYDVIDVVLESNNVARIPPPALAVYRWRERRWVARSDAVVTVNEAIADHLVGRWGLDRRPTVLVNAQPLSAIPTHRPDLIRRRTGIPPERKIVLFLGRLGRERGLDEVAAAVLRLPDAALVLLGFGPWAEALRARDDDPVYRGRHFTLPPVHPDEVVAWTASADVSVIAVPANSLNQRLSTPNKFWESLAAGTPVVVGQDLTVMRRLVEEEGLGAVADPQDPADLARALGEVLDQPEAEYQAMRQRCRRLVQDRFHWEAAVEPYLGLVAALLDGGR
jgi:glycosyltransferase involved in cell wall biosynthesis